MTLSTKLQSLLRLLSWTGNPTSTGADLGIPGIGTEDELPRSKAVERAAIEELQRVVRLAQRDVRSMDDDIIKLREIRNDFLRCRACRRFMKKPLFISGCHHVFCGSCLVSYLWRQGEEHPEVARHECLANGCHNIIRVPPREVLVYTAVSEAIWFATYTNSVFGPPEWCPDDTPTFEGLFP